MIYKFFFKGDTSSVIHDVPSEDDDDWIQIDRKGRVLYDKHDYPLYAYTCVKKYAKDFKKQRNMNNFVVTKSEYIKEDYNYLTENYPENELQRYYMNTRDVQDDNICIKEVDMICTMYEYTVVTEDMLFTNSTDFKLNIPIKCFSDKYREALNYLNYNEIRLLSSPNTNWFNDEADADFPDLINDELALLLFYFCDTF